VLVVGLDPAVVHGELLEIAEDAEGELGSPAIAAELEGGAGVVLDIYGGALGFEKEFACAADAEAVVGGFGGLTDFDGVFVDDVLVGFGVAVLVVNVPAERLEEGVEEFAAELGFIVVGRAVGVAVAVEPLDQFKDLRVVVEPSGRRVSLGRE